MAKRFDRIVEAALDVMCGRLRARREAMLKQSFVSPGPQIGAQADAEVERRRRLLREYMEATGATEHAIYSAAGHDHSCHKPEFYKWKRGELPADSKTARSLERFLALKKPPTPRQVIAPGKPGGNRENREIQHFPARMPHARGMKHSETKQAQLDFGGRWVSDIEYSRLTGISRQCLANWRWLDNKAGGVRPGFPIWRKFGADTVRYWVGRELLPDPNEAEPR